MIPTEESQSLARIRWHCHRGMLELDLILLRFFEDHYVELDPSLQQQFQHLLEQPDPDLFAWLMGYETTCDLTLIPIIDKIRQAYCGTRNSSGGASAR